MTEWEVERILVYDWSADTDQFRAALLVRCLDVLGSDDSVRELDEDDLSEVG